MSTETPALLYLNAVTVSFDGFKALNALSLAIDRGEMRAIIGPNGAGKTTMMDVITGKTRADEGEALFAGVHDPTVLDEARIAELGIGRKFQRPTVFESHTVYDNLQLALKAPRGVFATLFASVSAAENDAIEELLETVHLSDEKRTFAANLSHGQKQWLEIGMLLAQDPQLLLVDEPAAGMTDAETVKTARLLREINRTRTVVVVEHDMDFVRALDVKVTVLHEGSVLAEGPLDHVSSDERVIEVYLGEVSMLAVENLDLRYGAAQVLWNLSLTATRGQVTCIMGRNGVGKTSLLRGIVGHQPISGGRVLWEGKDIAKLAPFERARLGIAYVPQGREIFPLLSVKENLESGYAALKGHARTIPEEVFELFPVLKTMLSRRGGDLSGGQQQQLAIGRAMVMRPSLILLDEPTEGIQPSIIKDIGRAIRYLRDKGEMAIVLVEQYFDFACSLADRFAVMDRGQIIVAGTRAEMVEANVRRHLTV